MKQERKILISSVLNLLAARDPAWADVRMKKAFKTLYDGWRQAELRHKHRSNQFYTVAWRRGWLDKADFGRFKKYALQ